MGASKEGGPRGCSQGGPRGASVSGVFSPRTNHTWRPLQEWEVLFEAPLDPGSPAGADEDEERPAESIVAAQPESNKDAKTIAHAFFTEQNLQQNFT